VTKHYLLDDCYLLKSVPGDSGLQDGDYL